MNKKENIKDDSRRYAFLEKLLKERSDTISRICTEVSTIRIVQLTETVISIDKTIAEWK